MRFRQFAAHQQTEEQTENPDEDETETVGMTM
jgi:hypothetical protein